MEALRSTTRLSRLPGKDPPMRHALPPDIKALIYEMVPEPLERLAVIKGLEEYVAFLKAEGRFDDCDEYLESERQAMTLHVEQARKDKSRGRFKVVLAYLAPAFVTVLTQVITHNLPVG